MLLALKNAYFPRTVSFNIFGVATPLKWVKNKDSHFTTPFIINK